MNREPTSGRRDTARRAFRDGAVAISPLMIGVAPFGLIFGVTAAGSAVGAGLGYATSVIIFAGAAQLAGHLVAARSEAFRLRQEGAALLVQAQDGR